MNTMATLNKAAGVLLSMTLVHQRRLLLAAWREISPFRLSVFDFRHGHFRRLLCCLERHARVAHPFDGSDQRHLLGDCRGGFAGRWGQCVWKDSGSAGWFGFGALVMAAINIFGGFLVTQRMLAMYKKKDR